MANIYSIYLNDLETILMYAAETTTWSIDAWKKQVPLLGVCRLWTNILYPVVYRTAYVEYNYVINVSQPCIWKTNIDCIASRGCHHVVRSLHIIANGYVDAAWSASQLTKKLNFNKMDWSNIQTLHIFITFDNTPSIHKKYSKLESNELDDLAHKFLRYMPSVKSLFFYDLGLPGILSSGVNILVPAYAPQLQQLFIYSCLPTSRINFTTQLTCLSIDMLPSHSNSLAVTNVFARTLQKLRLFSLSANYDWSPFYDYITPGHIYFDSLRWLEISYTSRHNSDTVQALSYVPYCPYILHFPKLQRLDLHWCPPNCILLSAEFPAHYLTQVSIDDRSLKVMYEKLYTIKARQLYVHVRSDPPYNSTYYLAMNSVFGKLAHFTRRMLRVIKWNVAPDYEMLQWDYLDKIILDFTTSIQILSILPRAPQLSELSVDCLDFGDDCSLSAIEHAAGKENSQLCLELKVLNIRQIRGISPRSAALAFIQHLITRATNLQELVVPADYKHDVIFIISRMKQSMPHFESIFVASKAN